MRLVQAYVSGATWGLKYENQRKEINKAWPCDEEYISGVFRIATALLHTAILFMIFTLEHHIFQPNKSITIALIDLITVSIIQPGLSGY